MGGVCEAAAKDELNVFTLSCPAIRATSTYQSLAGTTNTTFYGLCCVSDIESSTVFISL